MANPSHLHIGPLSKAFDLLNYPAPRLGRSSAREIARQHFSIEGPVRDLTSERDQNFLIDSGSSRYVLKISNALEDPSVTDLQTSAVLHALQNDPDLPLPQFYRTNAGDHIGRINHEGVWHSVRLLEFLPGRQLKESGSNPTLDERLGRILARLTLALADFRHSAADHTILWDLNHFVELVELMPPMGDPHLDPVIDHCFEDFQSLEPEIMRLPEQVIYNDLNDSNVLLDDRRTITGLIDFGDVVRAPRIFDVAVAASYRLRKSENFMSDAGNFLNGYQNVTPLNEIELAMLPTLVRCRLATTVLITRWRSEQFPGNREYILRNHDAARDALFNLSTSRT